MGESCKGPLQGSTQAPSGIPTLILQINEGFAKLGEPLEPFGGPFNKDYSILGSILGSPYFGKLPNVLLWSPHTLFGS